MTEIIKIRTYGDEQRSNTAKIRVIFPQVSPVTSDKRGISCINWGKRQIFQGHNDSGLFRLRVMEYEIVQSKTIARQESVKRIDEYANSARKAISTDSDELDSLAKILTPYREISIEAEVKAENNNTETTEKEKPNQQSESEYMTNNRLLFEANKAELLKSYKGKYILYEDGKVVDKGDSRAEVAMRAYRKSGMRELFIELVTNKPLTRSVFTPFSF